MGLHATTRTGTGKAMNGPYLAVAHQAIPDFHRPVFAAGDDERLGGITRERHAVHPASVVPPDPVRRFFLRRHDGHRHARRADSE